MVMLNFQEPLNIVTGTSVLLQRLKELGTQNLEKHTHTHKMLWQDKGIFSRLFGNS